MTNEQTSIMTSSKPDKDPNALKIASFRTKEGVWAEFCQKAESIGLTATDVIKAAMEQFIAGEYTPTMGKSSVHHDIRADNVLTWDKIIDIVNTVISTASVCNYKHTDGVLTRDDVANLVKAITDPINEAVSELEDYTRSQFAAVRDELKKAIGERSVTTEAVAQARPKVVATVPDPVSPQDDGVEYLSFHQLARELGYVLPVELKDKPPQVRATALIAFAATLGQSYGWNGKKQKLYRTSGG
jgi:hypothetical protein